MPERPGERRRVAGVNRVEAWINKDSVPCISDVREILPP